MAWAYSKSAEAHALRVKASYEMWKLVEKISPFCHFGDSVLGVNALVWFSGGFEMK